MSHMSRHKLPAPPLVLQPILCRVPADSSRAQALLDVARFLSKRGLLTDGGEKNLEDLFQGRGEMVSLTTQDVRAWAHALALELLEEISPPRWPDIATVYFNTYDKGKPRRPNRMQRLYMEWSADAGWLGMLEACQNHSQLWVPLVEALQSLEPDNRDARFFRVFLQATEDSDWKVWQAAYHNSLKERQQWLCMLPYFEFLEVRDRLAWLDGQAESLLDLSKLPNWASALLLAYRKPKESDAVVLPAPMMVLLMQLLTQFRNEVDPRWIGVLTSYRVSAQNLAQIRSAISDSDPIHRIALGPRPGRPWLPEMWALLEEKGF